MESTGKYWIPVYNILETDCKIVLAHPKYVKAIRGKKTDKKDAKWIAACSLSGSNIAQEGSLCDEKSDGCCISGGLIIQMLHFRVI